MKYLLILCVFMIGCASFDPIREQAIEDNTRTDSLIDELKKSEKTTSGRVVDEPTWTWLESELNQCKADRVKSAKIIKSLNLQIKHHEQEFQECNKLVNEYAKDAGVGEFVYTILYITLAVLFVVVVFLVYLIFKNLSLKRLIVG